MILNAVCSFWDISFRFSLGKKCLWAVIPGAFLVCLVLWSVQGWTGSTWFLFWGCLESAEEEMPMTSLQVLVISYIIMGWSLLSCAKLKHSHRPCWHLMQNFKGDRTHICTSECWEQGGGGTRITMWRNPREKRPLWGQKWHQLTLYTCRLPPGWALHGLALEDSVLCSHKQDQSLTRESFRFGKPVAVPSHCFNLMFSFSMNCFGPVTILWFTGS